jgi:hypothetical protein
VLQQPRSCTPIAGNAKRPLGFPAGAIPTVDFLLYHPTPIVKKRPVKTHDRVMVKRLSKHPNVAQVFPA